MTSLIRAGLVVLGCGLAVLLAACSGPTGGPAAASVEDVRSVEILYSYSGWSRADEVHRLQRGSGQRSFTRTSKVDTGGGVETSHATVPERRVGELLWALSAPPWPRERAAQVVARRVRPLAVLEHAGGNTQGDAPGCTADEIFDRMHRQLQGAALRSNVDAHYQSGTWTDDYPVMRIVISFRRGPDRVITSRSQKLLMLPWTLGDFPETEDARAPLSWSAPVSDAVRLLPLDSQAAQRLGRDGILRRCWPTAWSGRRVRSVRLRWGAAGSWVYGGHAWRVVTGARADEVLRRYGALADAGVRSGLIVRVRAGLHTAGMGIPLDNWQPGAAYYFSAHLRDRRSDLLVEHAQALGLAFRVAQQARPFRINAIVVLPNHLHGVWTLPAGDEDGHRRWLQIQAVFDRQLPGQPARAVVHRDRSVRPLWHDDFREHRLLDAEDVQRHVAYVHDNPVRHGLVRDACEWPYSSIHRRRAGEEEPC